MSPRTRPINVYLLDDHDLVRRGLRDLLATARDIHVVGESRSAVAAPDLIRTLHTDVMVLDLHLQDGTGVHVCRRVRAADPRIRGLLLTASSDDEAAIAAVLSGAAGYITKFTSSVDLIGAIRRVGSGEQVMEETLRQETAAHVLSQMRALQPAVRDEEVHILSLVTDGLTDAEIAERLGHDPTATADHIRTLIDLATSPQISSLARPPQLGSDAGKHRAEDL